MRERVVQHMLCRPLFCICTLAGVLRQPARSASRRRAVAISAELVPSAPSSASTGRGGVLAGLAGKGVSSHDALRQTARE